MPATIKRTDHAAMFGPTKGDKVRLADTDLIIEVERDLTAIQVEPGPRGKVALFPTAGGCEIHRFDRRVKGKL